MNVASEVRSATRSSWRAVGRWLTSCGVPQERKLRGACFHPQRSGLARRGVQGFCSRGEAALEGVGKLRVRHVSRPHGGGGANFEPTGRRTRVTIGGSHPLWVASSGDDVSRGRRSRLRCPSLHVSRQRVWVQFVPYHFNR